METCFKLGDIFVMPSDWREIAKQASREQDPEKLLDLAQKLIEAFNGVRRPSPAPDGMDSRWGEICQQLANEHDPDQFERLMSELYLLLEQRQNQLRGLRDAELAVMKMRKS